MESNIINIATLTIDTRTASDAIVETRKNIDELQKANSELRKNLKSGSGDVDAQTRAFIDNENKIKSLKEAYKQQNTALSEYTAATLKSNAAMTEEAKSISQANAQNKELIAIRNQVNGATKDGQKAINDINAKLDQNNKFIKDNSSALEQQKQNVGNYGQISKELNDVLSKQGGIYGTIRTQVVGFQSTVSGAVTTVKDIHNGLVKASAGIVGFGNASKIAAVETATLSAAQQGAGAAAETMAVGEGVATVASGSLVSVLGVLLFPITAIIAAGLILYSVFKDFGPVINPIKDGFAALSSVFTVLKSAIFDLVTGARSLSDIFNTLGSDIAETAKETYNLEAAQRSLNKAMSAQEVQTARNKTKIQDLLLLSRDLTKTAAEREALITEALKLEESDFKARDKNRKAEKEIAIARLIEGKIFGEERKKAEEALRRGDFAYAQALTKKKGLDKEALDVYKQGLIKKEELAQESDAIQDKAQNRKNRIIEKDQAKQEKAATERAKREADAAQKALDLKLKNLADTRIIFETEQHSADELLLFYEDYYKKLDELQGGKDKVKNAADLSSKLLEITKKYIAEETDAQKIAIEAKKEISMIERDDLIANAEFLKETETKRINDSILNEADKATALLEINSGYTENLKLINAEFDAGEAARREEKAALAAVDFELRILAIQEQGLRENEAKLSILAANLEEEKRLIDDDLANKKITADEATAYKLLSDKKYAAATKKIDKEVQATKRNAQISIVKDALAAASSIFGESKALSVASALINTYQGITAELSTKAVTPYEIGLKVANVAIVAASGFAAVKNILKTDKGSTGGDSGSATNISKPAAVFENPAKTQTTASVQAAPAQDSPAGLQPVLVLETLNEVKGQQQIKINSN